MCKFRTIKNFTKEIKKLDPSSDLTEHFIRCLCKENKIPFIKQGNRVYIDLEKGIEALRNLAA